MKFEMNRKTLGATLGYGVIPQEKRGVIKGKCAQLAAKLGGAMTNAEYAAAHGITSRQASKQRRRR
jgi:hypothetical protein